MTNNNAMVFGAQQKKQSTWIYKFLLFLSFVWVSFYPSMTALSADFYSNYGNIVSAESMNFGYVVSTITVEALFSWLFFEVVFYLYRLVLSFKVYSFVVPPDKLKTESRIFFIYRNVFYGLFLNLCFLVPYLYAYAEFINLAVTLAFTIVYASVLNKNYGEPVIGHFVFKNFCYPLFFYEALMLLSSVMEVLG